MLMPRFIFAVIFAALAVCSAQAQPSASESFDEYERMRLRYQSLQDDVAQALQRASASDREIMQRVEFENLRVSRELLSITRLYLLCDKMETDQDRQKVCGQAQMVVYDALANAEAMQRFLDYAVGNLRGSGSRTVASQLRSFNGSSVETLTNKAYGL